MRNKGGGNGATLYYSGNYAVPCNALGRWVSFAVVISDGAVAGLGISSGA